MNSMNNIQNINLPISKYEFFKECIKNEIGTDYSHFLCVSGINEDFLTGDEPIIANSVWCRSMANRHMIRSAIWHFYNQFDRDLYESIENPRGIFSEVIYAKFRSFNRKYKKNRLLSHDNIQNSKETADEYIIRTQCEKNQMLLLGNGDMEKGRQRFVKRMQTQRVNTLNKKNKVSLGLEHEFNTWINSNEANRYTRPMKCFAPKQFNSGDTNEQYHCLSTYNLTVNNKTGIIDALIQLSNHPYADTLTIDGVFEWNEHEPFSIPHSHTLPENNVVYILNNYDRINQGDKIRIIGYINVDEKSYIVSSNISNSYRRFPTRFEKLESRNSKVSSMMSVLYNIDRSLTRIQVSCVRLGIKYIMNIDVIYNGNDTVNATQIFDNNDILVQKKNESSMNNTRVNGQKKIKVKKSQCIDDLNTGVKKDTFKYTRPASINLFNPTITEQLMNLSEMFENGLLDRLQFESAKNKILS